MAEMRLLQLCAGQIRLNQPLPWNVRTQAGMLLLGKSQVIRSQAQIDALLSRGMYVDAEEFERARRQAEAEAAQLDPFYVWSDLARRTAVLLRNPAEPEFRERVETLVTRIDEALDRDPDIASFELVQMEHIGYPVLHSLQAASLATRVAARLGMAPQACRSVACAALTMNVAMIPLQAQLVHQRHPLTDEQRAAVRSHVERGVRLLEGNGVDDPLWLQAVMEHHEQPDGTGYPQGLHELSLAGRILQHCDVYLARIAARATRPAQALDVAARAFFVSQNGPSNPVAAAVVKEMGMYPPGTYVKLASGETAIVVRRGAQANTPEVYSLCNAEGTPFVQPLRRDTCQDRFKVSGSVPRESVLVRFDRTRLFEAAGQSRTAA